MPLTASLISNIASDHPAITLIASDDFSWNPQEQSLYYNASAPHAADFLLHELAHALLGHSTYDRDIELLQIEREAWDYARSTLAPQYTMTINETVAEDALETYRDWLHKRSLCPSCSLNGVQEDKTTYRCLHCHARWHVNEARACRLKRTSIKK